MCTNEDHYLETLGFNPWKNTNMFFTKKLKMDVEIMGTTFHCPTRYSFTNKISQSAAYWLGCIWSSMVTIPNPAQQQIQKPTSNEPLKRLLNHLQTQLYQNEHLEN